MIDPLSLADLTCRLQRAPAFSDPVGAVGAVLSDVGPAPEEAADATSKLAVATPEGAAVFVTVSGDGNPDLVARGVRRLTKIRRKLSDRYAEPIVEPLETGEFEGRSFAIWPMLGQLPQGRLSRYLTKRGLRVKVMEWLSGMLAETKVPAGAQEQSRIADNLARLSGDAAHSDHLRRAADVAGERLASGRWAPVNCAQHSDLWMGNVMMSGPSAAMPFGVIDWAGARAAGYPFFDLCRFAISSNAPSRLVDEHIARQLRVLHGEREDVTSYVLCALGEMQADLEHFPEEMFRAMAEETTVFARQFSQ